MSEPERKGSSGDWERRAADLANDVQRWLIKASARNMRDELGDQVKKAIRGQDTAGRHSGSGDVWSTATSEPARSISEAPECAWCPVCRAARRVAVARETGGEAKAAATLADVSGVLTGAVRDVLTGLDSMLSYRPGDLSGTGPTASSPRGASTHWQDEEEAGADQAGEPEDEPGHRG